MADPQATRFWRAALQSGLLDAAALTACHEAIPASKRDDVENLDRRLARQAVLSQSLTLWQAQQLMAGRTSGYKVDRYILLEMIGQGGMGRVYLARDSRLNRRVALKILSPERINNPRAIARFQREARVGAQLQHENLVRIYDFGESNGRFYLVMEFIEGRTIGALIGEGGPLPPAMAVRLVRQVALGLEHAHRKGLIHRDVNPYNIMVTHDGTAKLADLGLAIDLADEDHVTREGATVGTFDYVAPEQARHSHSADIRSDIYSLGCSLYHMLSGHVPFPSPSLPEKLFAHQAVDPKPLDEENPGVPAGLARIVARMMRKNPDERFATPIELAQALEPFAESGPHGVDDDGRPPRDQDAPPDQTPAAAIAAADHPVHAAPAAVTLETSAGPTDEPAFSGFAGPSLADRIEAAGRAAPEPRGDASVSDPEFRFDLDLGPEPSLSEGRPRPRAKSAATSTTSAASVSSGEPGPLAIPKFKLPDWTKKPALPGLVAGPAVILLILAGYAAGLFSPSGPTDKPGSDAKKKTDPSAKSAAPKPIPNLVVKTGDDDVIPRSFDDAINQTLNQRGWWIELGDEKPHKIAGNQAFSLLSSNAPLILRAAAGCSPVIELEAGRSKPLFTTGSSVPLELDGLTIKILGDGAPAKSPVIKAAGRLKIRNTRIQVAGAPSKGSRAILSDGGALDVEGCVFQGFDRALEIQNLGKTPIRVVQTMFIPSSQPPSEWFGWAVQVQDLSGATPNAKGPAHLLNLDHCTFEGAGFLDMVANSSDTIVQCEVKNCAIRAKALVAFTSNAKTPQPIQPALERVRWIGAGNQIDIDQGSWIVYSADSGTPALSGPAVSSLDDWIKVGAKEDQPIRAKIRFRTEPGAREKSPPPSDFAIAGGHAGADPARVGPGRSH